MIPLFTAPPGMMWVAATTADIAHLVTDARAVEEAPTLCGIVVERTFRSAQVGGFSRPPCWECIAVAWAERLCRPSQRPQTGPARGVWPRR